MAAAHHPAPALTHEPLSAFRPSDAELIKQYLLPKIAGRQQLLHGGFIMINEADVYSKPPLQLAVEHAPAPGSGHGVAGEWYFFTRLRYTGDNQMRWSRAVRGGAAGMVERWSSDRRGSEVDGILYGYVKKLYHREKEGKKWVRTGWAMEEFSYGAYNTVLCKVYYRPPRTRRAAVEAAGQAGTLAGEEVLLQEAANNLLNDDNYDYDRIMANLTLQHGEDCDWDAVFHGYLLPVGDGGAGAGAGAGAGDDDDETPAPPPPRQYRRRP